MVVDMVIEKYISALLFEHDCVIVPGLGGFIANYAPAAIHPVHHTFSPPTRNLAFNANLNNNDGLLANAIKNGIGVTYADACALIATDVETILRELENHGKASLVNIGVLARNKEKSLEFSPDRSFNHNADSFGLTTFTSSPIKRESLHEKIGRKLVPQHAVRSGRRLPASLKWAAVVVPLMAIGLWTAYNSGTIRSLYNNYASFMPTTDRMKEVPDVKTVKPAPPARVITAFPEKSGSAAMDKPAATEEIVREKVAPDVHFIIAGAFGVEENAQKFAEELRLKGYDSFIAGKNRRGLYRVSIEGFSDKNEALAKINEYRSGEFPGAWLLSME